MAGSLVIGNWSFTTHVFGNHHYTLSALVILWDKYQTEEKVAQEPFSRTFKKHPFWSTHRHAFSSLPGFVFKRRALYRARSCLPYPTMGDTRCFPTAEGSTKIHIINHIWSNQKPMTKAQQQEVSKPHSGHTCIPWSLAICLLFNQPRRINKILNTSTLAKGLKSI